MSLARKAGVVVVSLLLTTTLLSAALVGTAHLTVLDPDFVTTSLEEEGGYAVVEEMMTQAAGPGTDSEPAPEESGGVEPSVLMGSAITEEYVASQADANVYRAYAYLHGNEEELNLSIATAPIRENASAALEAEIRNASVAELMAQNDASLSGPVNATVVERMTANESSYEAAKDDFRAEIRSRVLDEAVDRAYEERSNDELIRAAGEDPADYSEAEKERFVREYESDIKAGLRQQIEAERGDEIDDRVEDRLTMVREDATGGDADTETEEAVLSVQEVVVRGLTTDASYDAFRSDLTEAKEELASATADRMNRQIEAEMPARIDLTENMSSGGGEPLGQARTAVTWLDRLPFVLAVVGAGLVGLLYHLRRSVTAVASDAGTSMLLAGGPILVGVTLAEPRLQSLVANGAADPQPTAELMVAVAGRVLGTLGDVAFVLVVAGVVLIAASLAARYGLVEKLRAEIGADEGDGGAS